MEITLRNKSENKGLGSFLLIVLRRTIALLFIVFALIYWAKIVAFGDFVGAGITTMPEHQQIASVILAVAMPVAAIGLWCLFPWGTSSWLAVLTYDLIIFGFYPNLYGPAPYIIWFHIASLSIYVAIKLALIVARKRAVSPAN